MLFTPYLYLFVLNVVLYCDLLFCFVLILIITEMEDEQEQLSSKSPAFARISKTQVV